MLRTYEYTHLLHSVLGRVASPFRHRYSIKISEYSIYDTEIFDMISKTKCYRYMMYEYTHLLFSVVGRDASSSNTTGIGNIRYMISRLPIRYQKKKKSDTVGTLVLVVCTSTYLVLSESVETPPMPDTGIGIFDI